MSQEGAAIVALAEAYGELYTRLEQLEANKRSKRTPSSPRPPPLPPQGGGEGGVAPQHDPWSEAAVNQALTLHITLDQQTELSQLAKRYLFDTDPDGRYAQLRHVARTAMPPGVIDWQAQVIPCWTLSTAALELAQAIYNTHFTAIKAEALAAQGNAVKLQLDYEEHKRMLWATVKERDALLLRIDAAERAQNSARIEAQSARMECKDLTDENARLLQQTKEAIAGALHDAGARVDALVHATRIALRTLATDAKLSNELVHQLMQLIQRLIIDAKCVYHGIPTTADNTRRQERHEKDNQ